MFFTYSADTIQNRDTIYVFNIKSARSNVQTRTVKHNRFKLTAYALFKDKKFLT